MKTPDEGRDWAKRWSRQVAATMLAARKRQGNLSAQGLSDRCAELGYPIPRSTIQNLEIGRKESISVQEVVILARALAIPPVVLMYPVGREASVEALPGADVDTWSAAKWFTGEASFPGADDDVEESPTNYFRDQDRLLEEWRWIRRTLAAGDDIDSMHAAARGVEARLSRHRTAMRRRGLDPGALPAELAHVEGDDHGQHR